MYQLALAGTGVALAEKVAVAVERLRTFSPPDGSPYWLAFSGGKDSAVIHRLAELAGVPFQAHLSVTTVDPPELLYHVRRHYPEVVWHRPEKPLWARVIEHGMPPTRTARWCCREYKECVGGDRTVIGVRAEESPARAKRWGVVTRMGRRVMISPIIDWTEADVWEFHRAEGIPYCSLYDEGFKRLGCVLCPMSLTVDEHIARWPGIARLWRKGVEGAWHRRKAAGQLDAKGSWESPEAMWEWWISRDRGDTRNDDACDGLMLFS